MFIQNRCRTVLLVLPTLVVIFASSVSFQAVAQSPSTRQPQLTDAQKAELEEATELNRQVIKFYRDGKYDEAATVAERVLKIREKVLGPNHADTAQSLNNLASMYSKQGNYASAERLFRRALTIWEKVFGPEHPETATSLNNLASLYESQGQPRGRRTTVPARLEDL